MVVLNHVPILWVSCVSPVRFRFYGCPVFRFYGCPVFPVRISVGVPYFGRCDFMGVLCFVANLWLS